MFLRAALDMAAVTGVFARAHARLAALAVVSAVACSGSAFSNEGAGGTGGAGRAGAGNNTAGAGPSDGGAAPSDGGAAPSDGGEIAYQGGNAAGGRGAGAEAGAASGAGGVAAPLTCSELQGVTYGEHCYAAVTAESLNQVDSAVACADLGGRAGRAAHLLVLETQAEQSFIIQAFLSEVTDAWLALTCSSAAHPELSDCYCQQCEDGLLLEKRAAWSWSDGSSADFGWSGNNPDGAFRCSALAYNPSIETWGWVDRSCLSTSHQLEGFAKHGYRAICELP